MTCKSSAQAIMILSGHDSVTFAHSVPMLFGFFSSANKSGPSVAQVSYADVITTKYDRRGRPEAQI